MRSYYHGSCTKRCFGSCFAGLFCLQVDPERTPSGDQQQVQDLQFHLESSGNEVRARLLCLPTGLHLPMVYAQHSLERVDASLQATSEQATSRRFSPYNSPLSPFVSFRLTSQLDSISTVDSFLSSAWTSSLPSLSLDTPVSQQLYTLLRPLKEGTLLKLDPKRAICQFEIPGAGRCRDATCPNVHLRAFDPNGKFTCPP
jgi:hypothetical protein